MSSSVIDRIGGFYSNRLAAVKARVERDFKKHKGALTKGMCLRMLKEEKDIKIPEWIMRTLRLEYEGAAAEA
jgi:hypothetical protein